MNLQTWKLEDEFYTLPTESGAGQHETSTDMIDDFLERELQDWMTTTSACDQPSCFIEPKKVEPLFVSQKDCDFLEPYPLSSFSLFKDEHNRGNDLEVFLDYAESKEKDDDDEPTTVTTDWSSCDTNHETKDSPNREFRKYQKHQWQEMYRGLLEYINKHGHCCVPNKLDENPRLGRWVKRQRHQYKLLQMGKQSTLTASRVEALEEVGFVWDSHATLWVERLNELKDFRSVYGHCNVPSTYPENAQLSTWVKCQRRQHKLYLRDKKLSNLTEERVEILESLGFEWDGRLVRSNGTNQLRKSS